MDIDKYLSISDQNLIKQKKVELKHIDSKPLVEKQSMLLTSIFGGIVGIDRFLLGDKIKGLFKSISFASIMIALITVLAIITGKVMDYYSGMGNGISRTITWADNVAIVGNGLANLAYACVGLLIGYILFVIFDGFLCYHKNMSKNYQLIMQQIK